MVRSIGAATVALTLVTAFAGLHGSAAGNGSFPEPSVDNPLTPGAAQESVVLAGGCFWGVQAVYQHLKGVISATSGYTGGAAKTAKYELVSSGTTGHAESVRVVYDPSQVSLGGVLNCWNST